MYPGCQLLTFFNAKIAFDVKYEDVNCELSVTNVREKVKFRRICALCPQFWALG